MIFKNANKNILLPYILYLHSTITILKYIMMDFIIFILFFSAHLTDEKKKILANIKNPFDITPLQLHLIACTSHFAI